jgi:hypothetical protein
MAGGVSDTEKNRFILLFGSGKGLLSPWIPVHGIVSVL